jgi:hypothetical protein
MLIPSDLLHSIINNDSDLLHSIINNDTPDVLAARQEATNILQSWLNQ